MLVTIYRDKLAGYLETYEFFSWTVYLAVLDRDWFTPAYS